MRLRLIFHVFLNINIKAVMHKDGEKFAVLLLIVPLDE